MLILLEGPDGAGKSTLAEELVELLGCNAELWHAVFPKKHPLDEWETPLFDYVPGRGRHIVCDRWHIGEWIYPEIFGRDTKADAATYAHLELFLRSKGAVVVWMIPPTEVLKSRIDSRGDEWVTHEMIPFIRAGYKRLLESSSIIGLSNGQDVKQIIRTARYAELLARHIFHNGSYVGGTAPNILLLGERTSYDKPYPPAFGPYPSTSGHYLITNYIKRWPLTNFGLANANEENVEELWTQLRNPKIVTLGNIATKIVDKIGIPHGAAPHPQYIRRFHHAHGIGYINMVMRAAYNQEDYRSWRP